MNQKKCNTCGETKARSQFHKHSKTKDGRVSKCKSCVSAYQQKRYEDAEVRAHYQELSRKYREANPEKVKEINRKWQAANRAYSNAKSRAARKAKKAAEASK